MTEPTTSQVLYGRETVHGESVRLSNDGAAAREPISRQSAAAHHAERLVSHSAARRCSPETTLLAMPKSECRRRAIRTPRLSVRSWRQGSINNRPFESDSNQSRRSLGHWTRIERDRKFGHWKRRVQGFSAMKGEGRAMMKVEAGCSGAERWRRRCQDLGQPMQLLIVEGRRMDHCKGRGAGRAKGRPRAQSVSSVTLGCAAMICRTISK